MKKNRILALVTALLLVISGFSAFAETAFEDIEFPDAMPSEPLWPKRAIMTMTT